jgi:hypothetical protein
MALSRHNTHPMREDVKQEHFSTLSVRPRRLLVSRPLLIGEGFRFNAWSATEYEGYASQLLVCLEWFHAAVPTPFVAKLRKPTVGLSANHHPM